MTATAWLCRRCAAPDVVSNGAVWIPGSYRDPPSPSVRCAECGAPVPDTDRARLASEAAHAAAEDALAAVRALSASANASRRRAAAGLLSASAAAARLGVNRSALPRIVGLAPVQKGGRKAYRAADVEALIERGFTLDGPTPCPPKKQKRRPAPKSSAASDPAVQKELAKF